MDIIIHVSEAQLSPNSGMGRVVLNWKKEFENLGFDFIHIGPDEVGKIRHPAEFPYRAYNYYLALKIKPVLIIVHEPAAGLFVNKGIPCFLESHGIEQRHWEMQIRGEIPGVTPSIKTRILYPLWRLWNCNKGIKKADKLLLFNSEDAIFVKKRFNRKEEDIFIFKNGVEEFLNVAHKINDSIGILFNASWIARKGTAVLMNAAKLLFAKGYRNINYTLIGTGIKEQDILKEWPTELRPYIKIIPKFLAKEEIIFLQEADIFVLPSYFEGQPLSLLQAMAAGKCCITTNCCGQKDFIKHGKNGFLFQSGNFEELAYLIEDCINEPVKRKMVAENAMLFANKRNWKIVSSEIVDFILNNIGRNTDAN